MESCEHHLLSHWVLGDLHASAYQLEVSDLWPVGHRPALREEILHWFGVKVDIPLVLPGRCDLYHRSLLLREGNLSDHLFACNLLLAKSVKGKAFGLTNTIHIKLFPSIFLIYTKSSYNSSTEDDTQSLRR